MCIRFLIFGCCPLRGSCSFSERLWLRVWDRVPREGHCRVPGQVAYRAQRSQLSQEYAPGCKVSVASWWWSLQKRSLKSFQLATMLPPLPSGKSARSSQTCSHRTARHSETLDRPPSWNPESKAAWPTSASSPTASALRPSAPPWPPFRTTWTRRSNKWTRCIWAPAATLRDPQKAEANLLTKWTSTGNESPEENLYEQIPSTSLPRLPFLDFKKKLILHCIDKYCHFKNVCVQVFTLSNSYFVFFELMMTYDLSQQLLVLSAPVTSARSSH